MAVLETTGKISEQVRHWTGEIAAARRRKAEKEYRKDGEEILRIYGGKKKESIPFNILYSNTETLLPALYNNTPRPVVQRRFKDEDPLGKMASLAGRRVLEYSLDSNSEEYATFDSVVEDAVLDALLPGRGVSRVRYDAEIKGGVLEHESVCFESIRWNRVLFGFARKWKNVPWIAFEYDVTKTEATELFGAEIAGKVQYSTAADASEDQDERGGQRSNEDGEEGRKTARIYEIWEKVSRKVLFMSPQYIEGLLKTEDDPLGLTGFYPVPRPLMFLPKSNDMDVTALYKLYENQAKELNRITLRINRVVEALKVRGAYDGTLGDEIENILKKDDNVLVKAENVAALQDGGLTKAIWLMPLGELVLVLQQLVGARQQAKQVIYEITGLSDILRGQSVASETATAQEIKNQWGTLRLKKAQKTVQAYVREMLRIALEIAAKKFSEKTFADMTGLPFLTQEREQGAKMAQMAAQMSGQPPDPQLQQILATPTWAQVLEVLRNDTQRQYRIDIETNSTVDLEATEDQKNISEVLGAVSQFLQGVTPLVTNGSLPFEAAQGMLLGVIRRYRFGPEVEDYIKAMKPPAAPDQGVQEAQKLELQQKQVEFQARQQEMKLELQIKEREAQLKLEELAAKAEYNKLMAQIKMAEAQQKLVLLQAQAAMPPKPTAPAKGKSNAPA